MKIKTKNILILLVISITFFSYGFISRHFKIVPNNQIYQLFDFTRSLLYKNTSVLDAEPTTSTIETELQRLIVKQIQLRNSVIRSGAIAGMDNYLYVALSENNTDKERIIVYDMLRRAKYEHDGLRVPMNINELLNSSIIKLDQFDLDKFKIMGIYVEKNDDGHHNLFVIHHKFHEDEKCISFDISRTTLNFDSQNVTPESDWKTIFTAQPCLYPEKDMLEHEPFSGNISGGKMVNFDENTLLVSVGDYHHNGVNIQEAFSMDSTNTFGKFLLVDKLNGEHTFYATGSRNAQGLLVDKNGTIWSTEHGPAGGDELNIIKKGSNLGWPKETYGLNYRSLSWPNHWPLAKKQGRHEEYQSPVYAWMPSIAPTSIIEIEGEHKFKLWADDLIVASMREKSLHRLRRDSSNRIVYEERIRFGNRIRDITVLYDNSIALLTDEGFLLIIEDGGPVYELDQDLIDTKIAYLNEYDEMFDRYANNVNRNESFNAEFIFKSNCSACHSLKRLNEIGPHLNNLYSRNIGGLEEFNYSTGFRNSDDKWTPELLKSFLLESDRVFPNTSMPEIYLSENEADSLVNYLKEF